MSIAEVVTYPVRGLDVPDRRDGVPDRMARIRTKISISGFDGAEIAEGMPHFRRYLRERPWLLAPTAEWEPQGGLLVVTIETEGDAPNLEREGVLDEVWDCTFAAFDFSSERIAFDVLESRPVSPADP